MTTAPSVVQFVCFETPLPSTAFIPSWVPFADMFLAQGLEHIVLSERISQRGTGPTYQFISRNEWPRQSFLNTLQSGRIGDGGGGPVRASQGGTFTAAQPVPTQAQPGREKVMALLRIPTNTLSKVVDAVTAALSNLPDVHLFTYQDAVVTGQRFDTILEAYGSTDQGEVLTGRMDRVLERLIQPTGSSVEVYREVLTLPKT